jgi:hypothetical protein
LGAASVGGGPTDEQRNIVVALLHSYFGLPADPAPERRSADEVADAISDPKARHRFVETMVVLEFACHPPDPALADSVETYARALGVHDHLVALGRDALEGRRDQMLADYQRFSQAPYGEPELEGATDDALATTLRNLRACPPDSLGRAFFDFYDRHGIPFPGEAGGGTASLVPHDFTHVIAGYEPEPVGELALQAMLVAATDGDAHFSSLLAVLGLSEVGMLQFLDIDPKVGLLDRPGAAEALAEAMRRGRICGTDFEDLDHLSLADQPLALVRRDLGIVPSTV